MHDPNQCEIIAGYVPHEISIDAANPAAEWQSARPIRFSEDWQGENRDPAVETEVRVLWTNATLFMRFVCRYRELFVFSDSDANGRRDHLWDRDVAEAFLQPEPSAERCYKEFEIAPNGMWIDLGISPSGLADLKSGLIRSVHVDKQRKIWTAGMAIAMKAITNDFDPAAIWRANFYRVEGRVEPRHYMAWQPTHTPHPNFHVSEKFGTLRFAAD
jgi:Carbohydrate-binding family 9